MRYPHFLPKNGCIGFAAPSFGCATQPYRSAFEQAVSELEKMGYKTIKGPNVYSDTGIGISNTPQSCAEELNSMMLSDMTDMIISCGGGELMCEDIPFFDFKALEKASGKWYVGNSDNTNFTYLYTTLCDTASIYASCASSYGMKPWHQSLFDAMDIYTGKIHMVSSYDGWEKTSLKDETHPFEPYNITEKEKIIIFPEKIINFSEKHSECETVDNEANTTSADKASADKALADKASADKASGEQAADSCFPSNCIFSGRLLGGCLDCLNNIAGTVYDKTTDFCTKYAADGIIWYLESCDLNVMDIRRALWHLKSCGWFDTAKGFLIGRPYHFDEPMMGLDRISAVTGILEDLNVPIIMDIDLGHLPPAMPFVNGALAAVSEKEGKITLNYSFH